MSETTGVIVAGGRSTRMGGRAKALLEIAGEPLVARVAERLDRATDRLIVNCRSDQREPIEAALSGSGFDPTFAIDPEPDQGPIAGIATGLRAVDSEYAVVVAVDIPFVDPDILSYLTDRVVGHDAAVPRPSEWFEPLHAVYRPGSMITACERALETADPRIIQPLSSLDVTVVDRRELLEHGSLDSFEGIDTPQDAEWAVERLETK